MAEGKYIIRTKFLVILLIIFISSIGHAKASAWLPNEGAYTLSMGGLQVDKQTRKIRNLRNELFIKSQNTIKRFCVEKNEIYKIAEKRRGHEINAAQELPVSVREFYIKAIYAKPLLENSEQREINEINQVIKILENEAKELSSFSEESSSFIELEYGVNNSSSIGGKIGYNINKFADWNSGSNILTKSAKEIDVFYKYKIFDNMSWVVTLCPKLHFSPDNKRKFLTHADISFLVGGSKIKNNRNTFLEVGITVRKYFSKIIGDGMGYILSMQEGTELGRGFSISNYTEYEQAEFANNLYRSIMYDQVSIAKEIFIDNSRLKCFTTQIGYYWKTSLVNKQYTISGPIFSLRFNL